MVSSTMYNLLRLLILFICVFIIFCFNMSRSLGRLSGLWLGLGLRVLSLLLGLILVLLGFLSLAYVFEVGLSALFVGFLDLLDDGS